MFAFAPLVAAVALQATSAAPATIQNYGDLALNPRGDRMATIENRTIDGSTAAVHSALVVRDARGAVVRTLDPCQACGYDTPAWSPDGTGLAFVARQGPRATLYVAEGEALREVAQIDGLAVSPKWSADGERIALLVTPDAHKETGATQPGVRQVGEVGTTDDSRRIGVVPVAGGEMVFASPTGTFVYEYDWMPDGRGFAAIAADGNGDNNWWIAKLEAFGLDGSRRVLAAPSTQINQPRVSPDGTRVAFIGGLMSDLGPIGGDVFVVPVAGGTPENLTPGYPASFVSLDWRGDRLVAGVVKGGDTGTAVVDTHGRGVSDLHVQPVTLNAADSRVSLSADGRVAAYVSHAYDRGPRIEIGALGRGRPVTHDNDGVVSPLVARSLTWTSDGYTVQGWLLSPRQVQADRRYPMVVTVHGGPAASSTPRYVGAGITRALLDAGYFVFFPNPRGSHGQGQAFTTANRLDFGGGDLRDILAGVDAVTASAPVDPRRVGVYGHSYGGFMTLWAVTHTDRFRAAVAGAPIANWSSYYGQNGIDQWMVPYFGATFYDDPAAYDRFSPIRFVNQAATPTFQYVGERDVETPAAQALEFWHALKSRNVPTSLVIYQDEGHGIRRPANIDDMTRRTVEWFDRYMPAS